MSALGTITRRQDRGYVLHYVRQLDETPAKVWAALTEPAILNRWLARSDVDLRIGGRFTVYFFDGKETMSGVISALEPERLIEYSWNEEGSPQSLVRWTIVPAGDGCRLTLTHTLPAGTESNVVIELGGGWHAILGHLGSALRGGHGNVDAAALRALEARYGEIFEQAEDGG